MGNLQREMRYLLLMPAYEMGGAEVQFRYFIEYAEKYNWKLDVIIEQRFCRKSALLEKDIKCMKNVQFYQAKGHKNGKDKICWHIIMRIIKNLMKVKYKTCLIYCPAHLASVPVIKILGIHVIYSERVSADDIINSIRLQKCLRICDRVFANSEYAEHILEDILGKKVRLIRNGKPIVEQLALRRNRIVLRILMPCRIKTHKNQMLLLHYLKDYPSFAGKIVFAGMVEDQEYMRKLINYINRNHLQDRVEFLGYVEDMRGEYEKSDLIILPSFLEGTPNVVLEAYAYGRPVVVSDIATERYIVQNPNLRFELNKTEEINRCITYIEHLSDEEYRSLLNRNREFVIKNYSVHQMAEKIYAMLR